MSLLAANNPLGVVPAGNLFGGLARGGSFIGITSDVPSPLVDGRGWIGIVAYLFGNYNPVGAFGAAIPFGAADMFQIQLQTVNVALSATLTGLLPYVVVIVVLAAYGTTRMPSHVGEPYESEH